jgi:hypothetical protein
MSSYFMAMSLPSDFLLIGIQFYDFSVQFQQVEPFSLERKLPVED